FMFLGCFLRFLRLPNFSRLRGSRVANNKKRPEQVSSLRRLRTFPMSSVQFVYIMADEPPGAWRWVLQQKAHDTKIGSVHKIAEATEAVAERRVACDIDSHLLRNQEAGK